jgi:hypothetical protein
MVPTSGCSRLFPICSSRDICYFLTHTHVTFRSCSHFLIWTVCLCTFGSIVSNILRTLFFLLFAAVYMLLSNRITKCVVWSFLLSSWHQLSYRRYFPDLSGHDIVQTNLHWSSIQSQMITIHTILSYSREVDFNNIPDWSLPFSLAHRNSLCICRLRHPAAVLLPPCCRPVAGPNNVIPQFCFSRFKSSGMLRRVAG